MLVAGAGIPIDAVVADFIAGAAEKISPARLDGGWDLIEGQGSLFHPSYAGVSLGLLHGSQPDALVLCHEPTRRHMRGLSDYPLPELKLCLQANLAAAQLTNPAVKAVGVALNTSGLSASDAAVACRRISGLLDLPCQAGDDGCRSDRGQPARMLRQLIIEERRFPLAVPFRISRGVKLNADVVTVAMYQARQVRARRSGTLRALRRKRGVGDRADGATAPAARLRHGPRRVAGTTAGRRRAQRAGRGDVGSRIAAQRRAGVATPGAHAGDRRGHRTAVGIDTPEQMGVAAARIAGVGLIKVKVDADDPAARIDAVRRAAPHARLIVDPNESWTIDLLRDMQGPLARARVDLLEQPLPADADDALLAFSGSVPICADEACHETRDLPRMRGRYQAINIKLDKTGGLTEAWRLLRAARSEGFKVMIGCMVCSSLGIAPALELAREAA
ncbi:DUF1611 domain-containing protein, partial [Rhodanobacter lindaniclasticus]